MRVGAEDLWAVARALHVRGHRRSARVVKTLIFVSYRCILPPEVVVEGRVRLLHRGMGIVVDPDVRIVGDVTIAQNATIGTGGGAAPWPRVTLDGCFVGVGAVVLAPRGKSIRVGRRAAVGANAVVVTDVPDGHRVGAPPAVLVRVVPA